MTEPAPPPRRLWDESTFRWGGLAVLLVVLNVAVWFRPKPTPAPPPQVTNAAAYTEDDASLRVDTLAPRRWAILDVHEHAETEADVDRLVKAMDGLGIERACLLAASRATFNRTAAARFEGFEDNNEALLRAKTRHPDRVCVFVTLHPGDEGNAEKLAKYVERGADGLKLYLGHPGSAGTEPFHSMAIDDPRMYPVFEYAEKVDLPITLHIDLGRWGDELDRLLARFPGLRLDLPHFATSKNTPERLGRLARVLDAHPKVFVDVSFGAPDIQKVDFETLAAGHAHVAEFIAAHADRVMFASDLVVTARTDDAFVTSTLRSYMQLLEMERFRFFLRPERPMWGLALPDSVLEKVYRTTPAAFLKKSAPAAPR
ncbi:MAG: amidohydrolase family protein [Polyangiaceae bacterium]